MKYKTLSFVSLVLLMMVTGVFWGTWFTLTRSLESFSSEEFTHIGKVIISNVALPMRIIMPSCILFTFLSILAYPRKGSAGFYMSVGAFILLLITLLITLMILVPIDNQIKVWTVSSVPTEWEEIRSRWQFFHTVRTFTSMFSFGFLVLSFILSVKSIKTN